MVTSCRCLIPLEDLVYTPMTFMRSDYPTALKHLNEPWE